MMKKFLAVFLLMVYGFTSFGASVAVHQCSEKGKTAHHHNSYSHYGSSSCSHQAAHFTADCCVGNTETCTATNDEAVTEPVFFKSLNFQLAFVNAFHADGAPRPVTLVHTTQRLAQQPSVLHKLRLHLYNRILLI